MLARLRELSVSLPWSFDLVFLRCSVVYSSLSIPFLMKEMFHSSCVPKSDTAFCVICPISGYRLYDQMMWTGGSCDRCFGVLMEVLWNVLNV